MRVVVNFIYDNEEPTVRYFECTKEAGEMLEGLISNWTFEQDWHKW